MRLESALRDTRGNMHLTVADALVRGIENIGDAICMLCFRMTFL